MPSRIVREGILASDRVNELDFPGECFYRRLMSKVDDYGLYDARPSILRANLYPLKVDRVREADCSRWIAACVKAGLIALYQADGKPYLQMLRTNWQTRSEPKYPLPPWGKAEPPLTPDRNRSQPQTPVTVFGVGDVCGDEDVKTTTAGRCATLPDDEHRQAFQRAYPKRAGAQPWQRAWKAFNARRAEGHTWEQAIEGAKRYRAFVAATGKEGTEFVMQAATFLGPDKHFLAPHDPPRNRAERLQDHNVAAARDWLEGQPGDPH